MNEAWIPVQVLDKRIKDGWFGRSYYITVRFLTSDEDASSPITHCNPAVQELPANIENYYSMGVGSKSSIKMYRHSDGRFYTCRET